jgi:hypothetical protein
VSRFKPGIARAVFAEVFAVALTAVTWAGLRAFDRSLGIGDPARRADAIEIVLAGATLVVPARSARPSPLAPRPPARADGRILDAHRAEDAATTCSTSSASASSPRSSRSARSSSLRTADASVR